MKQTNENRIEIAITGKKKWRGWISIGESGKKKIN